MKHTQHPTGRQNFIHDNPMPTKRPWLQIYLCAVVFALIPIRGAAIDSTPTSIAQDAPDISVVLKHVARTVALGVHNYSVPLPAGSYAKPSAAINSLNPTLFATLPASPASLAELYWPMHDGDWKNFEAIIQGQYLSLDEYFSYQSWNDMYILDESGQGEIAMRYENGDVVWHSISDGGYSISFDSPFIFLKGSALRNGGTWSTQTTANYMGIPIVIKGTFSISVEGTVNIPLDTYYDCRKLTLVSFTATAAGNTEKLSSQGFVLAPGVGALKEAVVYSSGGFAGWGVLVAGSVGGIPIVNLPIVEITPPTVLVSSPSNGQRVFSETVAVSGTAKDNLRVTNVRLRINSGEWSEAFSTNHWINWTGTVGLTPGTNVLLAYAMDGSGNVSQTVTSRVTYVITDRLMVVVNPPTGGRISGATNGQLLEIGKRYTLSATPGVGFVFTNWTGSLNTNNRALSFLMQSNLTFTANFVDVQKPTVTITNPPANARLSNAVVTFRGTAKDNGNLDRVEYQLNGSPFELASGISNWSATVNLPAGTNVFRVKSIDAIGNESLVAARNVFLVVPSPLTLCTNGSGRVTGATNGQLLEVGRAYKLTATPALRNLFAIWSGDLSSTNPALTFLMQSNLTLCANFVTNPYVVLKGTFHGLFSETNEVRNHDRSGSFTFTLAEAGSYSASFQLGPKKLSATGKFDWLGQSWLTLKPTPASNVTVALQLDVTNLSAKVEGVVSNQFWLAPLFGYRAPLYPGTNASPRMGKYTLVIPGSDDAATSPGGDGYGTATLSKAGLLTVAGKLADGTVLNQSIPISSDGLWAMYSSLYSSKGSLYGWMVFSDEPTSDVTGDLSWIKPALATSKYYPLGFTSEHEAAGSRYVAPGTTNRVLNITNGVAAFTGGNLMQPITNNVLLTTNNKVTNLSSNKLTLTLTLTSGLFNGSVTDTNTGKPILFNGVLLQKLNAGYGVFLGTNQSGQALFAPAP